LRRRAAFPVPREAFPVLHAVFPMGNGAAARGNATRRVRKEARWPHAEHSPWETSQDAWGTPSNGRGTPRSSSSMQSKGRGMRELPSFAGHSPWGMPRHRLENISCPPLDRHSPWGMRLQERGMRRETAVAGQRLSGFPATCVLNFRLPRGAAGRLSGEDTSRREFCTRSRSLSGVGNGEPDGAGRARIRQLELRRTAALHGTS